MPKGLRQLSDSDILAVGQQTITAATGNEAAYGSTPAIVAAITALRGTFDTDVGDQGAQAAKHKAATAKKDGSRIPYENALADFRDAAKLAKADEALMAATSIPQGGEKVPASSTIPLVTVDTSQRLRHKLSWVEATTPDNKRRPRGVQGAAIYRKLDGPPPTDENDCTFLALDSNSPYTAEYPGEDAGKMAHYMLRWQMRDGTFGPWSETVSATITG